MIGQDDLGGPFQLKQMILWFSGLADTESICVTSGQGDFGSAEGFVSVHL